MVRVVIAVRDLGESAKRYQEAFGSPPPLKQVDTSFGAHLALIGGLPVGMMLVGKHFDEITIYRAAHAFEQAADWTTL